MKTRFLIPLGVFAALALVLGVGLGIDPKRVPSPLIDKPMPQFELSDLHRPAASVSDRTLRGHVSIFNVWASWCVACREEHASITRLAQSGEVAVFGLNYKDKRDDALRWLDQLGDPYQASAHDEDGRVGIDWGVYGVPETFVMDAEGVIRYKHIGPINDQVVRDKILPLVRRLKNGGPA